MNLDLKTIGAIKGKFYIPAYQRGYRWKEEVEMLLNDIAEIPESQSYCLQPIVVRYENGLYELIDGQQRMTTIYLIYKYLSQNKDICEDPAFTIEYETRKNSRQFLENIRTADLNGLPKNIDEYFIIEAFKTISNWFDTQPHRGNAMFKMSIKLAENIKVIWYEVDSTIKSAELFARLNIGKIPLTNAELVKALFLSRNNGIDDYKQLEIATQWDIIEKELHNNDFWYFITNESPEKYPTRIELIFDLMAGVKPSNRKRFDTFFYFDNQVKSETRVSKAYIWSSILQYYHRIKEWYENFDIYHKVGYLITIAFNLQKLLAESENISKTDFRKLLDKYIRESLPSGNCGELKYENNKSEINRLLLLHNIETIRQKADESVRFSFERHKNDIWSLEHIHAQHSEGLNKNEARFQWLADHKKSMQMINDDESLVLIARMERIQKKIEDQNDKSNIGDEFNEVFTDVMKKLTANGSEKYMHTLANLALLSVAGNATLNNSAFDAKRNKIINMNNNNEYIPICTRRVFMKYYSSSTSGQMYLWGKEDCDGYIDDMNRILAPYLTQKIIITIEEED